MRFYEFISEDANPKRQAAIAIAMKKAGKKPKNKGLSESKAILTEAILREAFLDSVAKFLGDKIKEPVKHVENFANSLQVLYQVIADPKKLDTITFLLKKRLKSIIASLPPVAKKLKDYLLSLYPEGRTLADFFKTLLLVALGRSGTALAMQIKDVSQEAILNSVLQAIQQIPQLAGMIVSQGASGIGNVLQTLKIGNALWFDILNQINEKIKYANNLFKGPNTAPLPTNGAPALAEDDLNEGENWSKYNHKRVGGMSKKSVSSYRRSHPGSKIQTAVTTKPSKLKKGSKAAKRRASFCARMRGMKKHRTSAKTAHDPNSNINKSLRRWHCESVEELHELVMLAEQFIRNHKK